MLRITVRPGADEVRLVLEGDLTGAWVTELEDCWRSMRSSLDGRAARVDLSAVDRVDQAGRYLLVLLRLDGARLIASGVALTDLVSSLSADWPGVTRSVRRDRAPLRLLPRGVTCNGSQAVPTSRTRS